MDRKNSSPGSAAISKLPKLEFSNSLMPHEIQNDATVFLPMHMEQGYSYPLLIWLGGSNDSNRRLSKVMPRISLRNYIGLTPGQGDILKSADVTDPVFECLDKISLRYNINNQRIFVAGCEQGGSDALRLALTYPDCFAGALSFSGRMPSHPSILGHLRKSRKTPLFVTHCREDNLYTEDDFCGDLKSLHVSGFSVTARQYPGTATINDQVLHDADVWMMEVINGYDMTTSDQDFPENN